MRPEARRRRGQGPGAAGADLRETAGTGEKKGTSGWPRPAACSTSPSRRPAAHPGAGHAPGSRRRPAARPRAVNRWYTCDITAGRDVTIGKIFDEADRRDPGHRRTWIALVDGDIHQLGLIQRPGRRPRHHPDHPGRLHPRAGIPVEGRLVLPPAPRPRDGGLGHRPGRWTSCTAAPPRSSPGSGSSPPRTRPSRAASTPRSSARPCPTWRPSSPTWTTPRALAERLADRHRRHRRRLPPPGPGPDGHHRRPLGPGRSPGHPLAPRHRRQRRHRTPTGTGTSPKNTSATTSAATSPASNSPPDTHSRRATPMSHRSSNSRTKPGTTSR